MITKGRFVSRLESLWRTWFDKSELERDLDAELRATLELLGEEKRASGMGEAEARRQARMELGGIEQVKEDVRDARVGAKLAGTALEIRQAFRMLSRSRGYASVAIVTLALGVASNTTILTLVHAVLLRPLPYGPSSGLVRLTSENATRGWSDMPLPTGAFLRLADNTRSLAAAGAYAENELTLVGGSAPLRVSSARVSEDLLSLMEVRPVLGRLFASEPQEESASTEVILGHGLWQRALGGRSDILGEKLELDETRYTVVGVMPPDFRFPSSRTELWTRLDLPSDGGSFDHWFLRAVARLQEGSTPEAAQSEIDGITEGFASQLPFEGGWRFQLEPFTEGIVSEARPRLLAVGVAVAFVLLLVCANLANLMLARAHARQKELAVRSALGAGTLRILRQVLIESLLLSTLAGLLGLFLVRVSFDAFLLALPAGFPRAFELGFDRTSLWIALGLSLASGLVSGLLPALQSARLAPQQAMKQGGAGLVGASGPTGLHLRQSLVIAEVALAFVLVVGATLLVRSFDELLQVEPGFEPRGVLTASMSLPESSYAEPEQMAQLVESLTESAGETPILRALGASTGLPTKGVRTLDGSLKLVRRSGETEEHREDVAIDSVTPSFFRTLGIPLVSGRPFAENDRLGAPLVAIINASIARRFFAGEDPVGRQLIAPNDEDRWTVVGVVGDVKQYGLDEKTPLQVYVPFAQQPARSFRLTILTDGPTETALAALTGLVGRLDPRLPLYDLLEMERALSDSVAERRLQTRLMLGFGLLALLVAATGIFSVISYAVSRRRHELGLRVALGADRSQILGMVLRQGSKSLVAGLLVGLAATATLVPLFQSQLFGVAGYDLPTFAVSAILLFAVGLVALFIPARRAARVDALGSLRYD